MIALLLALALAQDDRDDDDVRPPGEAERAYRLAHWERAEALVREAMKADDSARNRYALCMILYRARRYDECMRECEQLATAQDPADRAAALALKGAAAWRKGDAEGARTWSAQALEIADARAANAFPVVRRQVRLTLAFVGWRTHASKRFTVRCAPESGFDLPVIAARLEAAYDEVARALDASVEGPIDAFLFTEQRQADALLGVPLSFVAPRERALYALPDAPLGHLVAHLVSFYAASAAGKMRPASAFLNEGVGCAFAGDPLWRRRMDEIPAMLLKEGRLPELADLMRTDRTGGDFVATAGSFVRWLIGSGGRANFKRLWTEYQDHADPAAVWQAVYGRPLADLDGAWRATLRKP